jgi:hypothetical protein
MLQRTQTAVSCMRLAHKFTYIMISRLLAAGNATRARMRERIATFFGKTPNNARTLARNVRENDKIRQISMIT